MLFHVQMTVRLPHDMPQARSDELKAHERAIAQQLQREGTWRHLGALPAATPASACSTCPTTRPCTTR
jgi:muconolactone delta-isomerase